MDLAKGKEPYYNDESLHLQIKHLQDLLKIKTDELDDLKTQLEETVATLNKALEALPDLKFKAEITS